MKRNTNPLLGYYEAQMAGTAGIVRAALDGLQRVQQITLRAMRDGAGGQIDMARSLSEARDAGEATRRQAQRAAPATEQATRYQQELLQAITEVNTEVIRASYAMMERLSNAMTESAAAVGVQLPTGVAGGSAGMQNPLAMYEAGIRQWQNAVDSMSRQMGAAGKVGPGDDEEDDDEDDDDDEVGSKSTQSSRAKAPSKRKGARRQ